LFTGRAGLLPELRRLLAADGITKAHALHGMAGIGKTALAIEYAHCYASHYDVVWWITAWTPAIIKKHLLDLAQALGLMNRSNDIESAVPRLCGVLQDRSRWLLIYDGVEDPDVLADLLPSGGGHVLITSRCPWWGELAVAVPVGLFEPDESAALLLKRIPRLSLGDAERIAEAVDNLPLAVAQAAAYLDETGLPADQYLRSLEGGCCPRPGPRSGAGSRSAEWLPDVFCRHLPAGL